LIPQTIIDVKSQGHVLCAFDEENRIKELITPPPKSGVGERVSVLGYPFTGNTTISIQDKCNIYQVIHTLISRHPFCEPNINPSIL
jgi:hypothetical protein